MAVIDREAAVQRAADSLFEQSPDWATFYREIFGMGGAIRRNFPTREGLVAFEETGAYRRVQQMLRALRQRRPPRPKQREGDEKKQPESPPPAEPTQVITVRIPRCLHRALRIEAFEHRTSLNKLCISKLLQFIDAEMVPAETADSSEETAAKSQ